MQTGANRFEISCPARRYHRIVMNGDLEAGELRPLLRDEAKYRGLRSISKPLTNNNAFCGLGGHSLRQNEVRCCSPPFIKPRFFQYFLAIAVCTYPVSVRYNPTNCCGRFCRIGRKVQYGGRIPKLSAQPTNGRRDLCRTSSID